MENIDMRYSAGLTNALKRAGKIARRYGSAEIAPAHLLLAFRKTDWNGPTTYSVPFQLLNEHKIKQRTLRQSVKKTLAMSRRLIATGPKERPHNEQLVEITRRAFELARVFGWTELTEELVALPLLQSEGIYAVCKAAGIDHQALSSEIARHVCRRAYTTMFVVPPAAVLAAIPGSMPLPPEYERLPFSYRGHCYLRHAAAIAKELNHSDISIIALLKSAIDCGYTLDVLFNKYFINVIGMAGALRVPMTTNGKYPADSIVDDVVEKALLQADAFTRKEGASEISDLHILNALLEIPEALSKVHHGARLTSEWWEERMRA